MSSKRFEKLLQNSKTLVDSSTKSDKPQLERELGQIATESFLLKSRFNTDQGLNATAHYFLAQSGANTQEISENLNTIDTRVTFQPSEKITNNDVESHLKQVQKDIVIETVEEARRNTRRDFLDHLDDNLHANWKNVQRQILEEWDHEQEDKIFGRKTQGNNKQVQDLKTQVLSYASVIKNLNEKRLMLDNDRIIQQSKSLSKYTHCDKTQERSMLDSWNIAASLTHEKGNNRIESAYLKNPNDRALVVKMNRSLICSARSWLENEFLAYIKYALQKNAQEAKIGGQPDLKHQIKAFMRLTFKKNSVWTDKRLEVQNDIPIWLYVYLCVRGGRPCLAKEFVEQDIQSFYLSRFHEYLVEYLDSPGHRVKEESRQAMLKEYQKMVYGNSTPDPYKVLLYKIIGRCELEKNDIPEVVNTTEDYMWLELVLIREQVNEELYAYDRYRLSDFQKKISDAGATHFDPNGNNPWYYFKILLLSLQFEKAIDYLYKSEKFRLEAVHFGIALAYYGLIRIPEKPCNNVLDLLITEMDGSISLNFSRLVNQYVRLFVSDISEDALQYLYLITLYPTEDMKNLCREQISNYIVRSGDYKKILGSIEPNHNNTRQGSIEKFKLLIGIDAFNDHIYRDTILIPVARKFQFEGKYKDAVLVYEMGGQYTQVWEVLNRQIDLTLNRSVHVSGSEEFLERKQMDEDLFNFSVSVASNYQNRIYCDRKVLKNHDILLKFLHATIEYENGHYEQTAEIIKKTNILPAPDNFRDAEVAAYQFKEVDDSIRKHISQILEMTMESYYQLYQYYSAHNLNLIGIHQSKIATIKTETAAILRFVALIDFKIPADIAVKLNKKGGL